MTLPNKPAAPNAGIARRLTIGLRRRGVDEPERLAQAVGGLRQLEIELWRFASKLCP